MNNLNALWRIVEQIEDESYSRVTVAEFLRRWINANVKKIGVSEESTYEALEYLKSLPEESYESYREHRKKALAYQLSTQILDFMKHDIINTSYAVQDRYTICVIKDK